MRVIAGTARGIQLITPNDNEIRPTKDRTKEALFSAIHNYLYGKNVLDLFAGTGSLGIEALSRGARKCYFVDNRKESLDLVHENLKKSKLTSDGQVLLMSASQAISKLSSDGIQFDIVFLDPPYSKDILNNILSQISIEKLVHPDSIVIAEHEADIELDEEIEMLTKFKTKKYGKSEISFFKYEEDI
ncbi:16S rRNA (guanine(966)-N(2))-methyltransferase RsmD [Serpentinicella sp. ANB-PHB4]|uniref:16S rRNA (guanine(966)-N(2))-methyltransferase RsmD n=1 Tax=Serpentinicella sp. ANB-PHB4 TaxID=3074076 RepID=UPI00286725CF|nr:16S rRNA (guanine(966)-N(2))-methyltransferase RsmD [Serpentinicella sp. ANB-PHB4]MDR5658308.1 16S rRNA (guanine(966)-N(2))-methyltransferase RsmD [Serpentinicella sp. ANB-PHB4]